MKTSLAILTGGTSAEREVALRSAENVRRALEDRYEVTVFDFPNELQVFLARRGEFVCAIPVFHGVGGEDGTVQGFLETLGVPFLFSGVTAHAVGMDKALSKTVVGARGVRTAAWKMVSRGERLEFERASVIKVPNAGSSVGVFLARTKEEFEKGMAQAFLQTEEVLIEDFIQGDEFTVAVIDRQGKTEALSVIQIKSKKEFFDLESKYDPALAEEICPAQIAEELARELQRLAMVAHQAIGAQHVSRSDFMVDASGVAWFLEINTIPGMTDASLLPKALRVAGIEFGELLTEWIENLHNRGKA